MDQFQCPRGHFCFSDHARFVIERVDFTSFNARGGIFAFRTSADIIKLLNAGYKFQCPRGHFCFSDLDAAQAAFERATEFQCPRGHFCFSDQSNNPNPNRKEKRVSMPAGAFLLFGPPMSPLKHTPSNMCFNARGGIFAFRTNPERRYKMSKLLYVSMPARAFLLFGLYSGGGSRQTKPNRFQCPRGHFCFSDLHPYSRGEQGLQLFQCPRGHFCFSDRFTLIVTASQLRRFQCPRGHFCFSDPPSVTLLRNGTSAFQCPRGHFCFSDAKRRSARQSGHTGFNAREGIFAFRTMRVYLNTERDVHVSMPARAFLLFGR